MGGAAMPGLSACAERAVAISKKTKVCFIHEFEMLWPHLLVS
jgi:hypothetical protein